MSVAAPGGAPLRLATDIALQFRHLPEEEAAERVATHLRMFWDPRMRTRLREAVDSGVDCDPVVARAAALLPR
ncbi:formate dehydrogenase subunit delta [Nocardioides aequoreus]|uniref:formate dehydrogenase subunit delta n=1 Tax=Nocardioides aequoreus TaxID=397278 RepID=UPI0004C2E209|nr:formate dehydrogenase subunit delta [Nocardioides aequoreus]